MTRFSSSLHHAPHALLPVVKSIVLGLALACLGTLPAQAHSQSRGGASFRLDESGGVAIVYDLQEADLLDVVDVDLSSPREEAKLSPALEHQFPTWARLFGDGKACPSRFNGWTRKGVRGIRITGQARCGQLPKNLTINWGLSKLSTLDLMVVTTIIAPHGVTHAAVLSKHAPKLSVEVKRASPAATFGRFLRTGIEHILGGWDHLAFLLALLLGCATLRRVAVVVTGFTVAHSITLALGALGIVVLPTRFVEPCIAISIAAAALFGAYRLSHDRLRYPGTTDTSPVRWELVFTFAFGLVHGLGFASMLREKIAATHAVAVPLLGFNAGVEVGQLAAVALAYPILRLVLRTRFVRPLLAVLLGGLAAMGAAVAVARLL